MDINARISIVSSTGSTGSADFTHDFSGQELLLLRQLQANPRLLDSFKKEVWASHGLVGHGHVDGGLMARGILDGGLGRGQVGRPHVEDETYQLGSLWFLPKGQKERLLEFLSNQVQNCFGGSIVQESLLSRYFICHAFTEFHLDGIFKYGDDNTLPLEIFKCQTVRRLSLKYNYLDRIPADIGRMSNLEFLALTNNKLQNKSLPYSLTFCKRLRTLMLDNNLLDALPGFLLKMSSLETVLRHGNHNYFKSTFMWYHTDVNERILPVPGSPEFLPPSVRCPRSLQFWCAKSIIGSKINFFAVKTLAPGLCDYVASVYSQFNVCGSCRYAKLSDQPGLKVITFKNPYLGNTCVPFQHWACSSRCATALEIPAREEQIAAARELDRQYDAYVRECQRQYNSSTTRRRRTQKMTQSFNESSSQVESTELSSPAESTTNTCFAGCRLLCCAS